MTVGGGKSQIPRAGETQAGCPCPGPEAKSLFLWKASGFALKAFNGLDEAAHIMEGQLLYSKSAGCKCHHTHKVPSEQHLHSV